MTRVVYVTIALYIVFGCHMAMAQDSSAVKERIKGATIRGSEDGVDYVELLKANGSILGKDEDGKYTGEWTIDSKGEVCLSYDDDEEDDDCGSLSADGKQLVFSSDGSAARVTPANRKP